ncbi:inositol monophosphatase family protein [Flavobacterium sp. ANB]|jgi:myo-inositol-1(or 4)-monophosphatase|uniref:inositol monophosphatase family protein n=1 Tax=unclassified Flavobacterium TaxID=196869 RepID=UPI0012B7922F|nr:MULTISPECIES: inositol monophosphatase family protein [unclassified Flavobacterium]MBF4516957.1 inositol monophosphatase family protein [Flavobacterium sp. ANB]MTD69147.1 inositol monophosphatase family protein [Flavobacterium sp. LC2016-13]
MQNEINIPFILDAVRKVGDVFLKDYKQNAVPQTMDALLKQLEDIDALCLTSLKDDLLLEFPNIPWHIGDEFDTDSQRNPAEQQEYWLCDAMDGAIQYLQHIAGWTVNLALIRDGKPFFSVIYDPLANEMFWAKDGEGAFMNGKSLKISRKTDLAVMLAVFEYGHQDKSNTNLNRKIGSTVTKLLDNFGIIRNYGPHGLQLAYVGAGRIDLFVQEDLDTYNWIAGLLIAKEAGAEILTTNGSSWKWGSENLLVAPKSIAEKYLQIKATN